MHCFRAPVGGLFRHVCDLVRGQSAQGLQVGIICDSSTGDHEAERHFKTLAELCSLGVRRIPMRRTVHWTDAKALSAAAAQCADAKPTIVHAHGAKGGAYARLLARQTGCKCVYTPHGGTLHYDKRSVNGFVYLQMERFLRRFTDGIIFESQYAADTYMRKVGAISCPVQVIHNGLRAEDFASGSPGRRVAEPSEYGFVFVGELRKIKGLEVLVQAMHLLRACSQANGAQQRLLIVGAGPDQPFLSTKIRSLELNDEICMAGPIHPATRAFSAAKCVVIPSLAESFPYIVLEALAAAAPLITTRVGGIPEIYGPYADTLIAPADPVALAGAMRSALEDGSSIRTRAPTLRERVKTLFTSDEMVGSTIEFYRCILEQA